MKSVEMSRALTAAMSLRLPGTAGKLANKMRYVDSKGPLFHDGGLIRNITQGKHEKVVPRRETWKSAFLTLLPDAS